MARKSNTRGAQGAGTIRQRKDGRWEARYTVGRDPGTGKQIQRSVYGATQQEVRKKLAQLTTALDNGTYKEPCKMTVGQWLDIWTADYMGGVKPSTAFLYGEQIRLYIKPALGAVKLESQIDLVVQMERWQEDKFYDRLGLDEQKMNILGVELPMVTIPVQPGRNLAVIVEVAAMNNRHKRYGFNSALKITQEIEAHTRQATQQ